MGCGSSAPAAQAAPVKPAAAVKQSPKQTAKESPEPTEDTTKASELAPEDTAPTGKAVDAAEGAADAGEEKVVDGAQGTVQDGEADDKTPTAVYDAGQDAAGATSELEVAQTAEASDDAVTSTAAYVQVTDTVVKVGTADDDEAPAPDADLEVPGGLDSREAPSTKPSAVKSKTSDAFD